MKWIKLSLIIAFCVGYGVYIYDQHKINKEIKKEEEKIKEKFEEVEKYEQ